MTEPTKRTDYPPLYPPGTDWATDQAWEILDQINEGAISHDIRCFLAGAIAGMLWRYSAVKTRDRGTPL